MSRRTVIGTSTRDDERALLEALRPARDALVKASGKMATRSVYKAAVDTVISYIDELSACFAGDATYFQGKAPSSAPGIAGTRHGPAGEDPA